MAIRYLIRNVRILTFFQSFIPIDQLHQSEIFLILPISKLLFSKLVNLST
jgi:hypothetical protein